MNGFFFGSAFQTVFFIFFFLILGIIVVRLIQGLLQWSRNNRSPRLTVEATVVAKRCYTQTNHNNGMVHTSTFYYATFQVESGDRMELSVSGSEYGMLAEGDRGKLTFQGTRYSGFQRI